MKSIMINLIVFIFLFSKIKSSTICYLISGDLVSVDNCKKGATIVNNETCCYHEISYKNSSIPKKKSCISIKKDIDSINFQIALEKKGDSSINEVSIDCSNSFLKLTSFLLFILLF